VQYPPLSCCIEHNARHFTAYIHEQRIDRRFKELTLQALRECLKEVLWIQLPSSASPRLKTEKLTKS
jgi:hypothetical protein